MSITDELREWFKDRFFMANGWQEIHDIADRIDAEHEKAMSRAGQLLADAEKDRDYNYANWQECKQKVLQHNITLDELSAEIERLEDELAHCIELPKDADGEYIHVGDEMCGYGWPNGGVYCRAIVNEVTILVGPQDGAYRGWLMWAANECRHYHAPTVEDVLREFANEVYADADNEIRDRDFLCAKYAKRLTLAEVEDA